MSEGRNSSVGAKTSEFFPPRRCIEGAQHAADDAGRWKGQDETSECPGYPRGLMETHCHDRCSCRGLRALKKRKARRGVDLDLIVRSRSTEKKSSSQDSDQ
jgi:hypothetical protein